MAKIKHNRYAKPRLCSSKHIDMLLKKYYNSSFNLYRGAAYYITKDDPRPFLFYNELIL